MAQVAATGSTVVCSFHHLRIEGRFGAKHAFCPNRSGEEHAWRRLPGTLSPNLPSSHTNPVEMCPNVRQFLASCARRDRLARKKRRRKERISKALSPLSGRALMQQNLTAGVRWGVPGEERRHRCHTKPHTLRSALEELIRLGTEYVVLDRRTEWTAWELFAWLEQHHPARLGLPMYLRLPDQHQDGAICQLTPSGGFFVLYHIYLRSA
jgi:hypothetical protein